MGDPGKNGRDGGDDKPDTLSERDQFSRDAMIGRMIHGGHERQRERPAKSGAGNADPDQRRRIGV